MSLKLRDTQEVAVLRQRLWRLIWSSLALEQSTIKILERLSLHLAPPEEADVADVTDRLHEVFNAYSFLTRTTLWHELDDEPCEEEIEE